MAAVKFYRTTQSAFDSTQKEAGALYFLTDVGALHIAYESNGAVVTSRIALPIGFATDESSAATYHALRKAVDSKLTRVSSGQGNRVYGVDTSNNQKMFPVGTSANQIFLMPSTGVAKSSLASGVQESLDKADSALQTHQDISGKLNVSDATTAATENKVVKRDASGVSYAADFNWDTASGTALVNKNMLAPIKALAEQAQKGKSFDSYRAMINAFNSEIRSSIASLNIGQDIYIETVDVPDLWVSGFVPVEEESEYTYTTDAAFLAELAGGSVPVGPYYLSQLETRKVDISGKLDKVTSGGAKRVYGVTAANGQTMLPVGTNAGDLLEMPTGGIPISLLASTVQSALFRAADWTVSGGLGIVATGIGSAEFSVELDSTKIDGVLSSNNKLVTQAAVAENLEWHTL